MFQVRNAFSLNQRSHGPCFNFRASLLKIGLICRHRNTNNRCCSRYCGMVRMFRRNVDKFSDIKGIASADGGTALTSHSVQFLQTVVDCVCVVGTVRLVELRPVINPQGRKCFAEKLTIGKGLKESSCMWAWYTLCLTARVKRLLVGMARKLGERDATLSVIIVICLSA
ncbi:hypothetical protein AVEN_259726-1 [Araneus ventricosus]|uniref:Uncharacterized protein n=1 Tax=Araneus ventricosus TaxID=182803 RepID=A0A4Y2TEN4_ARAVE|nr:hypothetical protein AVEN_259726-1 [Araneus ventricosus]